MEKRWVRWIVCLLLFLSGGVFFKLMPAATIKFDLGWDAFSAIGTLGAVVVSLYLASAADRKAKTQERHRAELVAVRIYPVLQSLHHRVTAIFAQFAFNAERASVNRPDILNDMKLAIEYARLIKDETLDALVHLDDGIFAKRLSRALGMLDGLGVEIHGMDLEQWNGLDQNHKVFFHGRWANHFSACDQLLRVALVSCYKRVDQNFLEPTDGELSSEEHDGDDS